jgi:hypothetical protein
MNTKHQVHNLIILDESGSMNSIEPIIIQGFNELVQTIHGIQEKFPEQEHFVSFLTFNGLGMKWLHFMDPCSLLKQIDSKSYQPNASTPLLDAMGVSLNKVKLGLDETSTYNVLVTILTDGEENSSKEFTGAAIKQLVEELKQSRWTFTYIGTDHDVEKMAERLSINNVMSFNKSDAGVRDMFTKERRARTFYSAKLSAKEDVDLDYFKEIDEEKEK